MRVLEGIDQKRTANEAASERGQWVKPHVVQLSAGSAEAVAGPRLGDFSLVVS
jgi:hypothetical protein